MDIGGGEGRQLQPYLVRQELPHGRAAEVIVYTLRGAVTDG